jgi:glycosyltransferase involved in cell wall biosynthesis
MTYPAGTAVKRRTGKPLVTHVHATEFDRCGENINRDVYQIERHGLMESDRVIAVSGRTRNMLAQHYGIPPAKITVVYNGAIPEPRLDPGQIGKGVREKLVLSLGRITMQKGPDYFVEAARLVLNQRKDVRFVMAGSGDMLPRMMERMAELKMLDRFHFTGFLTGLKRQRILSMSDLYVMPSVSEPFGLTAVEALRYDIPVIISKQSGVAEVLPDAVQVDFWDVRKLAHLINDLLDHPELATRVVAGSQAKLPDLDWNVAARKVVSVYERLAL